MQSVSYIFIMWRFNFWNCILTAKGRFRLTYEDRFVNLIRIVAPSTALCNGEDVTLNQYDHMNGFNPILFVLYFELRIELLPVGWTKLAGIKKVFPPSDVMVSGPKNRLHQQY
eukprot:scaffold10044_cov180-Ochromonas_danica.AAC.2